MCVCEETATYMHTFYYDAPTRHPEVSMSSKPHSLSYHTLSYQLLYLCLTATMTAISQEKGHFSGHLFVHFLIDHHCSYISSSIFSKRVALKEGEHAFLCIPYLPIFFNCRFSRKGLKHDQLKLKICPGYGQHRLWFRSI